MSTIACKNSLFLHIPKTGGSSVSMKIGQLQIGLFNYGTISKKDTHARISDILQIHEHLQKWTIVRHPCSFLRSYYSYKCETMWSPLNWDSNDPIYPLESANRDNFKEYVYSLYDAYSNPITKLFQHYVDQNTIVGTTENLNNDLNLIIKRLEGVDSTPVHNVNRTNVLVEIDQEIHDHIWEREKDYFSQWYTTDGIRSDFKIFFGN